jgi:hypothetical protein
MQCNAALLIAFDHVETYAPKNGRVDVQTNKRRTVERKISIS